jgi:putative peptide zinc metalloprotease protein
MPNTETTHPARPHLPRSLASRLALFLVAFLFAAAPAAAQDNSAVAVNDKDGSTIIDLALDISRVTGDVTSQNVAVAYASCDSCTTVAIAIQILFVVGDPGVVAPLNAAIAINENCTSCQTLASAYQFVIAIGTPFRLTREGRRMMVRVFRGLRELRRTDLPIDQIQARLDELMTDLRTVLTKHIVPKKGDDDDEEREDGDEREAEETPAPEETPPPAATPNAEPTVTPEATAVPTETPTETPTPTPEQTPSETPTPTP